MTDEITAPAAEDDSMLPGAGPALPSAPQLQPGDLSAKQREKLLAAQLKEQKAAADLRARREKAAADREAKDARFKQDQEQRDERSRRNRERKADKRSDRADAVQSVTDWIDEHQSHLMLGILIAVPMILGWDGMSEFGAHYWGPLGVALPVVSETGMWYFDFSIMKARKKAAEEGGTAVVWPRYIGMLFFAALCAGLNFLHGDLGPIAGSARTGFGAGMVFAPVSVSGLVAHQIELLSDRVKVAKKKPQRQKVAKVVVVKWPWQVAKEVAAAAPAGGPRSGGPGGAPQSCPAAPQKPAAGNPGTAPAINGNAANSAASVPPVNGENLARGDKGKLMRDFWDGCLKEGKIPSAADMNEAAANDRGASLGGNNRRKWIKEPAAQKILGESFPGMPGKESGS